MAGIYIHIPFCKSKCFYCNFYSRVNNNPQTIDNYVDALCQEIELRSDYLRTRKIQSIYFGGGTPSVLKIEQLQKIFDTIFHFFELLPDNEVTLELNPDDATIELFTNLKQYTVVNRLSIGFQSFDNNELKFINRRHDAKANVLAIENANKAGFTNISGDLIFGLPNQTIDLWQKNLETFFSLPLTHLSAYSLSIEQNTVFGKWFEKNKITETDEDLSLQMYKMLIQRAISSGFEHYEISNFAKHGFIAKHNFSYWTGEKYLGIGAAAHSFDGDSRQWNVENYINYIEQINKKNIPAEIEILTHRDKFNEYLLTHLRMYLGVDMNFLKSEFFDYFWQIKPALDKFITDGLLELSNYRIVLTDNGKFVSDAIIRELFIL